MSTQYFCEIQIHMRSGSEGISFHRTCRSKTEARELAAWIHREYSGADPSGILVLEMPCRKRQVPRTVSFRTGDVSAITTVVGICDEDSRSEQGSRIEPGFRVPADEISPEVIKPAPSELVAKRKVI